MCYFQIVSTALAVCQRDGQLGCWPVTANDHCSSMAISRGRFSIPTLCLSLCVVCPKANVLSASYVKAVPAGTGS